MSLDLFRPFSGVLRGNASEAACLSSHMGSRTATGFAVVCLLLASVPAGAQPAAGTAASPVNASFAIRGFSIKGENPLTPSETSKVLAPFLRADANIDVLQKATSALESALRDAGFGLHRVALPPQEVGDTVALEIVKFAIGKVVMEGRERYSEANIRASIPELQEGGSPNFKRLAVQTSMANENPGKQIAVALKESEQPDTIDVTVQVKESKPWNMSVGMSNTGAASSGRDRTTLSGGHSNVFDLDHQFNAAYTTSLERIKDVKQVGLSYRIPLYRQSGVLGLSYTKSDVLGNFSTFTSTGKGSTLGANFTYHLGPEGGRRSFWNVGLDDKVYKASIVSGAAVGVDRRSRPLTLGYSVKNESDSSVWTYNADLAINTSSGAGNTLADYQAEDPRITTRAFKVLHAGASYSAELGQKWLWSLRSQWQYSPQALISGEQFGLGGASSVRGATERVLLGDRGLFSSLEITSPELVQGLRASGFVDAGWLSNQQTAGTTKLASDNLASIGLGLRYVSQNGLSLSVDYGHIVTGSALPLTVNSSAPQKGSDRLHLNLSVRF